MQEYVIVLPKRLRYKPESNIDLTCYDENILLVLKDKPAFLKGKLNLIGGKIECGEMIVQAAIRELKEESGLSPYGQMSIVGQLIVGDYLIHCLVCDVMCKDYNFKLEQRPEETESVQWIHWNDVKNDERLISSLKYIIPLMYMGIKDWSFEEKDNSLILKDLK